MNMLNLTIPKILHDALHSTCHATKAGFIAALICASGQAAALSVARNFAVIEVHFAKDDSETIALDAYEKLLIARELTRQETIGYMASNSQKALKLKAVACGQPLYFDKSNELIIDAAKTLFPHGRLDSAVPTGLQFAITSCLEDVFGDALVWLLEQGFNPDLTTETGETLLHRHIAGRGGESLQSMIKAGANVNAVDALGDTALHRVAKAGYRVYGNVRLDKVRQKKLWDDLIAAGANPLARNKAGELAVAP